VLLGATFGKVDRLQLSNCMNDFQSFSCLTSAISSGLVRDVVLEETSGHSFTQAQMSVLSQGLSLTNSLEGLLIARNLSTPGVSEDLVEGFESISLCCCKSNEDPLLRTRG
jgi:hypothetical protein